ncbi:MAG: ABC transporter ATP-binding protein [Clostridia bacterium]|nr:ABC transporter ATP-binding protein [Clostridia bacterium]
MEKTVLKCENLNKKFGKKQILKNVSLEMQEGDILGFIGPNGAGKTTTIKLILGLQSITEGKVCINGYDIEKHFTKAIRKVGAIVENPDLYMYLSGYENLRLIANLYQGINQERIDEVVKLVKLENRIKDKVSKYSLGMRQRLGIAQAILHKPNLLILDEPTNGLDPEGIKEMRELLVDLAKKEKMGILISSHNLAELDNLCTKVCIIKNGEIIETSDISGIKREQGKQFKIFEVDDSKKVKTLLPETIEITKNQFKLDIPKEKIPETIIKLVENNVKIYGIKEEEKSLEQAFFEKTGGNVIE